MLRLRFADFSRATRSRTLPRATARTQAVLDAARGLLTTAQPMIASRGLTLVGISVGDLEQNGYVQLELPFAKHDGGSLDAALDAIRDRYGAAAVTRGVLLGKDPGLTMPMLPD
jgi:DNA polymerase-4